MMQWATSCIAFQVFGIISFFLLVLSYYYSIIYASVWCPAGFVPFVTCLNVHMSPFYLSDISNILVDLSAPGFYFDFTVFQQDLRSCAKLFHTSMFHIDFSESRTSPLDYWGWLKRRSVGNTSLRLVCNLATALRNWNKLGSHIVNNLFSLFLLCDKCGFFFFFSK